MRKKNALQKIMENVIKKKETKKGIQRESNS